MSLWRGFQLSRRGFKQIGVQGDAIQLGGAVVVARGGRVVYLYAEGDIADHAPAAALSEALARAR